MAHKIPKAYWPTNRSVVLVAGAILDLMRANKEPPTQRAIAKQLGVSVSGVHPVLKAFASAGLITRSKTGGRILTLHFTSVTDASTKMVLAEMKAGA